MEGYRWKKFFDWPLHPVCTQLVMIKLHKLLTKLTLFKNLYQDFKVKQSTIQTVPLNLV